MGERERSEARERIGRSRGRKMSGEKERMIEREEDYGREEEEKKEKEKEEERNPPRDRKKVTIDYSCVEHHS